MFYYSPNGLVSTRGLGLKRRLTRLNVLCLVPSQPLKVVFKEVGNSSIAVHWHPPSTPNGLIAGYRIYYMHDNFTDVETVRSTNPSMFYVLRGLSKKQRRGQYSTVAWQRSASRGQSS